MSTTLEELEPVKNFFIGIDSDGCTFDTMEIKHKKCFCPVLIDQFDLHPISEYVRETWEFVNLYSRFRGTNRFSGFVHTFDLLAERKEYIVSKVKLPELKRIRNWVSSESRLGNPSLKKVAEESNNTELAMLYEWSFKVNESISKIVRNVPPFPYVKKSLEKINKYADAIVISSANQESLNREWSENDIDQYVRFIAGQEIGNKNNCFKQASAGKYSPGKMLMIGDAPGDLRAARANNALFFPIVPGKEADSWEYLYTLGLDRFLEGTYSGQFEEKLITDFFDHLPEQPPWDSRY